MNAIFNVLHYMQFDGAEASGEARRESDREVHDVSRISTTREGNRPGKGNVTHAVKGARPHVQENQATSWGSFAGTPKLSEGRRLVKDPSITRNVERPATAAAAPKPPSLPDDNPSNKAKAKGSSVKAAAAAPAPKSPSLSEDDPSNGAKVSSVKTPPHTEHERRLAFAELRDLMATAETALEQMWTQAGFSGRSLLDSYGPQGLRRALRNNGTPSRVFVEHIRLAMKKRPEWAGWYYHVFGTDRRRYRR
ncbi:hypothetical protein LZ30DRAFT_692673 [Colletotrichum cereale]|nr:hypothetical protein LZ30DRAFT_692673 [Colletotrichum cereale]